MERERQSRLDRGDTSIDWRGLADELGVPEEQAWELFEEAGRQAARRALETRAVYLALLQRDRKGSCRPSPGKSSLTMRLQVERERGQSRPRGAAGDPLRDRVADPVVPEGDPGGSLGTSSFSSVGGREYSGLDLRARQNDDMLAASLRGESPGRDEPGRGSGSSPTAGHVTPPEQVVAMATRGPASPIPFRSEMESLFDRDFSAVEAFFDRDARAGAHLLESSAFAAGNQIVFDEAQPSRDRVIRELAHVVQQGAAPRRARSQTDRSAPVSGSAGGRGASATAPRAVGSPHSAFEREAALVGSVPALARSVTPRSSARGVIMRDDNGRRFQIDVQLTGGLVQEIDDKKGECIVRFDGEPWLVVRWDPASLPDQATLAIKASGRLGRSGGKSKMPIQHGHDLSLIVQSSFDISVGVDRAVEQSMANASQADLTVHHDFQLTGGRIRVVSSSPPGMRSPWQPVDTQGPRQLLTYYQFVPVQAEIPLPQPRLALVENPPHWIFSTQPDMESFVASQSGPWRMWKTEASGGVTGGKGADTALPGAGVLFVATQLTEDGIAAQASQVRGEARVRSSSNQTSRLLGSPGSGQAGNEPDPAAEQILGYKIWDGTILSWPEELANYYMAFDIEAERDAVTAKQSEGEVFAMIGTQSPYGPYYGRQPMSHVQAMARWQELDANQGIDGMSHGHRLFRSLAVRGHGNTWVTVDEGYFRGRQLFLANLPFLKSGTLFGRDMVSNRDGTTTTTLFALIRDAGDAGDDLGRWLRAQLFRDDPDPVLLQHLHDSGNLAANVEDFAVLEVENAAQRRTHDAVRDGVRNLDQLGTNTDALRSFLVQFPLMTREKRAEAFRFLGLDKAAKTLETLLARPETAFQLALGNRVGGFSLATLQQHIASHRDQLEDFRQKLQRWEIIIAHVDGEAGTMARELAYQELGFRLDARDFPHRGATSGVFPGGVDKGEKAFASLGEQMWANHATSQANAQLVALIGLVTASVAATVLLIMAASVAGAAAAGLLFTEGTFAFAATEVIVGGLVFTGLQEGMDQVSGQGKIDLDDPSGSAGRLGTAALWNIATFGAFRVLSSVMGALSRAAVVRVIGEDALKSSGVAQNLVQGLRITGIGASFVAINEAAFLARHGRLPQSPEEQIEVVYAALLSVALLEAGAVLSRPFVERVGVWARARRLGDLAGEIDAFQAAVTALNARVARYTQPGGDEPPVDLVVAQEALLERQVALVRALEARFRTQGDAEGLQAWAQKELTDIQAAIATLEHARFLREARLTPVAGEGNVYEYDPGGDVITRIRTYYGADRVKGPDAEGVLRVSEGDRIIELRPRARVPQTSTAQDEVLPAEQNTGLEDTRLRDAFGVDYLRHLVDDLGLQPKKLFKLLEKPGVAEMKALSERFRALRTRGVKGELTKIERDALLGQLGARGELEAMERWLAQGNDVEALPEMQNAGKNPDYRVNGRITEVKTSNKAPSRARFHELLSRANRQFKARSESSGGPGGVKGDVEILFAEQATGSATFDQVARELTSEFTPGQFRSIEKVSVYWEGELVGIWQRTEDGTIVNIKRGQALE